LLELEASGVSTEEIRDFLSFSRARTGQLGGDLVNGEVYAEASVGMIREIVPAAIVVQEWWGGV
jgi:hypothetical protein